MNSKENSSYANNLYSWFPEKVRLTQPQYHVLSHKIRTVSVSPAPLIMHSLRQLTDAGREAFYNLSYVNFPQDHDPDDYPEELALAIFQTNAVAAGQNVALFPMMARLNHGCSSAFNSVYSWREHEGTLVVYALKAIEKGQVGLLIWSLQYVLH